MRDVIQIATFAGIVEVDGRRSGLVAQGEQGEDGFETACGTEGVTGHGFGTANRQFVGVVAKSFFNRAGLGNIAGRS